MSFLMHRLRASLFAVATLATPVWALSHVTLAAEAPAVEPAVAVDFDPAASTNVDALAAHLDTVRREMGELQGTAKEQKMAFIKLMRELSVTCQRIIDLDGTGLPRKKAHTFKIVSHCAIAGATGDDADKAAFDAAVDEGLAINDSGTVTVTIFHMLDDHVRATMHGKQRDLDQMLADAQKKIDMTQPGLPGLVAAKVIAPYFVGANRPEGLKMLETAIALNADSNNPEVQQLRDKVEGLYRRSTIIGKPLELSGTMLDGSELDWSAYRGKVVLVDFFATWCGPCRAEMPHVLEMYEKYQDHGFEVLGISLDDSRENAESYVAEMKLPWKTMFPVEEADRGWNHPLVTYLGIDAIPQAILVDQDGNVINLNARGDKLTSELQRLLAPAPVAPLTSEEKS
ncbi:TlpA family protein disulfide reductase [Blastopirellula retiformator]|uniref:Thiol-disulfide oxidoreductase ResA n=1 Tax=Blastopirellula retiformator TaxID=2527970 RepID=A0A5C5UTT3_9BACT|nr:TlpA disulfide reductase family protein [Blastopirellula retiformator]TWT29844.1 Thiol-disulfide oxidoreductase ResA [Blastopirellula retiformator]